MNDLKLDNDCYLKNCINHEINQTNSVSIDDLKFNSIKEKKEFILKIDFNAFQKKDYKKILRRLLFFKSKILRKKRKIGITKGSKTLIGYMLNYDEKNKEHNEFIKGINAIFYENRYDRYNYIYDTVCDYLDSNFYGKNLCEFKNNQCAEKRNTSSFVGCCRHYKTKWLGPFSSLVTCEYLNENYTCSAKCISCKLFTCDYLEKKGIKFKIKDILLLDVFFNPLQKYFIKTMVFTPKDKILKRLMLL